MTHQSASPKASASGCKCCPESPLHHRSGAARVVRWSSETGERFAMRRPFSARTRMRLVAKRLPRRLSGREGSQVPGRVQVAIFALRKYGMMLRRGLRRTEFCDFCLVSGSTFQQNPLCLFLHVFTWEKQRHNRGKGQMGMGQSQTVKWAAGFSPSSMLSITSSAFDRFSLGFSRFEPRTRSSRQLPGARTAGRRASGEGGRGSAWHRVV